MADLQDVKSTEEFGEKCEGAGRFEFVQRFMTEMNDRGEEIELINRKWSDKGGKTDRFVAVNQLVPTVGEALDLAELFKDNS